MINDSVSFVYDYDKIIAPSPHGGRLKIIAFGRVADPDPDPVGSGMFCPDPDPELSFRIRIRPI